MTYVLDTHPVVWFLESSRRPSVRAGTVLRDPSHVFILPTVVLVEITYLFTKGRDRCGYRSRPATSGGRVKLCALSA